MTDNSHHFLTSLDEITHFRVTQIASFFDCPRRWKANLLGEGEQKESPYAAMGTAVHLAIEEYLAGRYDLPDGWDGQRRRLAAAGVNDAEVARARDYLLELAPYRDRKIALEYEFTLLVVGHIPPIRGHIDYLGRGADRAEKLIVIRDHKTNRTPHSADWWRSQVQPRLYAWGVRQIYGDEYEVDFEIGYVNLGTVVRWRTNRSEDRAVIGQFLAMWHAYQTYRRTGDWPEFVNEHCSYCPLKSTCGRLKRSQTEFLGALAKKKEAGWTLARRYQWATHALKAMEAEVATLKGELIAQIDAEGTPQVAGDVEYSTGRRSQRAVAASALHDELFEWNHSLLTAKEIDAMFVVRLAVLDHFMADHPEEAGRIEALIQTSVADEATLTQRKVPPC